MDNIKFGDLGLQVILNALIHRYKNFWVESLAF